MRAEPSPDFHVYRGGDVGELLTELELDTVTLSTLRAYVQALGGKLRVVADFGDQEYRLM